uniref:Uncharacterized protein n=1 Tax=Arundo donax TaxID=35708 RepID=A0A0A9F140_ARUDO
MLQTTWRYNVQNKQCLHRNHPAASTILLYKSTLSWREITLISFCSLPYNNCTI